MPQKQQQINAGVIVIGNEILSGRTQDVNISYLGKRLAGMGISLDEARIIPDIEQKIVDSVHVMRERVNYLFTTGGIGPTHDDITSAAIAKAFGKPVSLHPQAIALLEARYGKNGLTESRLNMARMPEGATLVENPITLAPGFQIENLYVLAGVPEIMQAMFDSIAPTLQTGNTIYSKSVYCFLGESLIAGELSRVQHAFSQVDIGSYPFWAIDRHGVNVVVRGSEESVVTQAANAVAAMIRRLGGEPTIE